MLGLDAVLRPAGISWSWQNEYTDEIHPALEGFEGFLGNGDRALAWFEKVVRPAVEAAGRTGGAS